MSKERIADLYLYIRQLERAYGRAKKELDELELAALQAGGGVESVRDGSAHEASDTSGTTGSVTEADGA